MKIVEVTDVKTNTVTRVGMAPGRDLFAQKLQDLIIDEELYEQVEIEIYDGEMPDDVDEEEVERAHELGQLLYLRMGWA